MRRALTRLHGRLRPGRRRQNGGVRDSAYRFFPLRLDPLLGVTLHPFDLAMNKILALVGRLEVRDWVDAIESHDRIQPLGCLAWAACGKDPGFSPAAILEFATGADSRRRPLDPSGLAIQARRPRV